MNVTVATDLSAVRSDPCQLLDEWLGEAERDSGMENHNAMTLATVGADGRPSARVVLRKGFDAATGRLTFFTNYTSRKACEIEAHPDVAIAMHWDSLERQVRIEGRAERVSPEESDAYFCTRPRDHQIGAWASDQSKELEGTGVLIVRALLVANEFADRPIERPPHWGGYAVTPSSIEFWHAGPGRIHQRLQYVRDDEADGGWRGRWLFP